LGDLRDPGLCVACAISAFFLPDIGLQIHAQNRRLAIQRQLPGFVDLLALTLESGLDLLAATERIMDQMKPNPLRDEIRVMLQESRLGSSRKDILQRWAHRTGLPDTNSLASLIIQAEEMGTGLAGVLRTFAEDLRNRRVMRAEEFAGKIPVKILFPMVVFFFPIVFVIILGPIALDMLKNLK
jgi:tight adherence protein C